MGTLKILASCLMSFLGVYFMWRGKKIQNVQMIVWGGVLIVLSYFIFSGGSDEQAAKDLLKNAIPSGDVPPATPGIQ